MHTANQLSEMRPTAEFFIGIDSDGCVFDSMELKHKECFCPAFIHHFDMQPANRYAREVWDFVNLYSRTRGCNRFKAVVHAVNLIAGREQVRRRGVTVPPMNGLREWMAGETRLGNPALEAEVDKTGDPDLRRALAWSLDVNAAVARIVHGVSPFPLVRESLGKMRGRADAIVVSQTPTEALEREWREHDIDSYVRLIAGQELGSKTEHIALAARGKYAPHKTLMIGDAPGDHKAAEANEALFYPINPGDEEASWTRFHDEALDRFFAGTYAGDYQRRLLDEFYDCLPEKPPWKE